MMETAILIIFTILFFWLAWKKTETALVVIALLLPAYLVRFTVLTIPTTMLEAMIMALFAAWLIKKLTKKDPEKISLAGFGWPAAVFLLAAAISVFTSPDLRIALGLFKAYFLEPMFLFMVLINTVKSARAVKLIIWSLGMSALFISLIALWQYLKILPSYQPWVFEHPMRVTSVFDYPNAVGLFLCPLIVLFLGFLLLSQPKSAVFDKNLIRPSVNFITGVIVFSLMALVFSVSRGAFIGIIAGIIFYGFFSRLKKQIWISLFILAVLALALPQTRNIIENVVTAKDVSTDVRTVLWQGTWNMLTHRPITGAGLGGFSHYYEQYKMAKHTELLLYPHNIILNFWSELGLLGLLAFIWLMYQFFKTGWKLKNEFVDFRVLPPTRFSVVLMGAMVSILAYGMVEAPYFKNDLAVLFWVLLGLMAVTGKITSNKSSASELIDSNN